MPKITPFLWFDTQAEEAANHYVSISPNSRIVTISRYGEGGPCGWLKDKYGLSWQVNPRVLSRMVNDADPRKAKRTMDAILEMKKIVIEDLPDAFGCSTGHVSLRRPQRPRSNSCRNLCNLRNLRIDSA